MLGVTSKTLGKLTTLTYYTAPVGCVILSGLLCFFYALEIILKIKENSACCNSLPSWYVLLACLLWPSEYVSLHKQSENTISQEQQAY